MNNEPININVPDIEHEGEKIPAWFGEYTKRLADTNKDLLDEVKELASMKLEDVKKHIGGNPEELPYEFLDTMLITGSDDEEMALILRSKREKFVHRHPDQSRGVPGIEKGISTFDGRFIPQKTWVTASDSEKRGALVGSTCFHYNSDTPGMGSDPKDRF